MVWLPNIEKIYVSTDGQTDGRTDRWTCTILVCTVTCEEFCACTIRCEVIIIIIIFFILFILFYYYYYYYYYYYKKVRLLENGS